MAALRVEQGREAAQVADAMVSKWHQIAAALSPVIGRGGVAALYKRSVHLTCPAHPWLAGTNEGLQTAVDVSALKAAVAQQDVASAAAGGTAFLETFYALLAGLVGPSLAGQLIRSAGASSSGGPLAKDNQP
jgi:hypothetical protein